MIAAFVFAQAVAGPYLPALPRPRLDAPCPVAAESGDVVVCGRNDDHYRLHPLPEQAQRDGLPKAEVRIGNAKLAAEAEQATLAGGQQSPRMMVRLKMPFGGKKRP